MSVSTIGYPVDIPVAFSMPSSTEMTLFMTIAEESNQTLEQYNTAFKDFSIHPKSSTSSHRHPVTPSKSKHMQKVVPSFDSQLQADLIVSDHSQSNN